MIIGYKQIHFQTVFLEDSMV